MARVLGVDACRGGWVGVSLDGDEAAVWFGATLAETVAAAAVEGQQAYRIGPKVLDANGFAREHVVVEAHPELCFATMGDGPLRAGKKTAEGQQRRRDLLKSQGIDVSSLSPGRAAVDDLLDAAAVAWTARRHLRGEASPYPRVPEVFGDGLPAAIWV